MVVLQNQPSNLRDSYASKALSIETLLYLATMGGADLCGLSDHIGNFAPGKQFDATLINIKTGGEEMYWEPEMPLSKQLEKFLFCGNSSNISVVWVRNRIVGGHSAKIE